MVNSQQQDSNIYILGLKSKCAKAVASHPWLMLFSIYLFFIILFAGFGPYKIKGVLEGTAMFLIPCFVIIRYYALRRACYKIIIDNNRQIIRFYLMFNKGVVEGKTSDVKVVIKNFFFCIINGKTIRVDDDLLNEVVSLLPKSTEIQFIGYFGKFKERDYIRRNIMPVPGSRLRN